MATLMRRSAENRRRMTTTGALPSGLSCQHRSPKHGVDAFRHGAPTACRENTIDTVANIVADSFQIKSIFYKPPLLPLDYFLIIQHHENAHKFSLSDGDSRH